MNSSIRNLAVLGVLGALTVPSFAVNVVDFHFAGVYEDAGLTRSVSSTSITSDASTPSLVKAIDLSYDTSTQSFLDGSGVITHLDDSKVFFSFYGDQDSSTVDGIVVNFFADALHTVSLNGGGSVGATFDNTGEPVLGQFYGEYTPVPEPASMAAMALGIAGFVGRRKKGAR